MMVRIEDLKFGDVCRYIQTNAKCIFNWEMNGIICVYNKATEKPVLETVSSFKMNYEPLEDDTLSTGLRIERKPDTISQEVSEITKQLREIAEGKKSDPDVPTVQPGSVFFTKVDAYGFYWYTIILHNDIPLKFAVAPEIPDKFRFCIADMERRESQKTAKTVSAASPNFKGPNPISLIDDVTGN